MSLEYATRGLVGILTPQANTTAEPELSLLYPPGVAMITARLISDKNTISARLIDYFDSYEASLRQFANAPVNVVGVACTGASYLAGRECEEKLIRSLTARYGYPFVTAASAIVDALVLLKARDIGIVSPYSTELTNSSVEYWKGCGFEVKEIAHVESNDPGFHPIYELSSLNAVRALRKLANKRFDAVLMLGTGMPTLGSLAAAIDWNGPPVLSSNFCLAWRTVVSLDRGPTHAATLTSWIKGDDWLRRLRLNNPDIIDRIFPKSLQ
jgi:maleate isomerase